MVWLKIFTLWCGNPFDLYARADYLYFKIFAGIFDSGILFYFPGNCNSVRCNVLFKVRNGLFVYTYSSCRIHSEYAYL